MNEHDIVEDNASKLKKEDSSIISSAEEMVLHTDRSTEACIKSLCTALSRDALEI